MGRRNFAGFTAQLVLGCRSLTTVVECVGGISIDCAGKAGAGGEERKTERDSKVLFPIGMCLAPDNRMLD